VLAPHPSGIRRYLLLTRPLVCLELENVRGDRQSNVGAAANGRLGFRLTPARRYAASDAHDNPYVRSRWCPMLQSLLERHQ
jgi:hypothetical protein